MFVTVVMPYCRTGNHRAGGPYLCVEAGGPVRLGAQGIVAHVLKLPGHAVDVVYGVENNGCAEFNGSDPLHSTHPLL